MAADFVVPGHWEVTTMAAVGRAEDVDDPDPGAETPSRRRRSIGEILWLPLPGSPGLGGVEKPSTELEHGVAYLRRPDEAE